MRPDSDLMCLTPEAAAERRPKTASEIAYRMAEERLSAARASARFSPRGGTAPELARFFESKLGDIEPNRGGSPHRLD